jgi:hypothetical protein
VTPRRLLARLVAPLSLAFACALPAGGADPGAAALWDAWPHSVPISPFALKHQDLRAALTALAARHPGLFRADGEGVSAEGRGIPLLLAGKGPATVLLWSQMHGDEPTATSALLDVLEYLGRTRTTPDTERLLARLTIAIIPMLNPDGAERTRRTNAQGIDINRDALRLQTPEGRFLKEVRDRLKPVVGYNLHNHGTNVTAGRHGPQVAISVLSVPYDEAFSENEGRRTTRRLAVLVERLLRPFAPGRVARYDTEYTARAFGDSMTRWGTPTLLIESGGFFGPDEANVLVRLNFVALVGTLSAIADGSLANVDPKAYDAIPLNTRDRMFDLLVRNARVVGGGGLPPFLADVGINVPPTRPAFGGSSPRASRAGVFEIGDLTDFLGKTEIDLAGKILVVAPPGGDTVWKTTLADLVTRGRAKPDGTLTLSEGDLSGEAKIWLAGSPALAPGYAGDFLVLVPAGPDAFRVERRLSPAEP